MANRNRRSNIRDERIKDTTMYGEFIASFDQWTTPDRQKEIAKYLEKVTKEISPEMSAKDKKGLIIKEDG